MVRTNDPGLLFSRPCPARISVFLKQTVILFQGVIFTNRKTSISTRKKTYNNITKNRKLSDTHQVSSCQSWNLHRAHQKQRPHRAVCLQLENRQSTWLPCSTAHSEFRLHLMKENTDQLSQTKLIFVFLQENAKFRVILSRPNQKMSLALWCMKMCAVKIANHFLLFLILPD